MPEVVANNNMTEILSTLSQGDLDNIMLAISSVKQAKRKQSVTLGEFQREYRDYAKSIYSLKYCKSIDLSLRLLINQLGEYTELDTIKNREAEQIILELQKTAPKGVKVYQRTLKAVFNKAMEWEYITNNPFQKIKIQRRQEIRPAFLYAEDLDLILLNENSEILRNLIRFTFYTGCRLSEVVNLKWQNINMFSRIITIGDKDYQTKSRKQRVIPICDDLYEVICKIIPQKHNDESYVFCKSNGFPYNTDYISKRFKKLCRKSDIQKEIHFHSLRHSFASNLVQKGVSLYVIKDLMGHQSVTTTEIYSHLNAEVLKEATAKLNKCSNN